MEHEEIKLSDTVDIYENFNLLFPQFQNKADDEVLFSGGVNTQTAEKPIRTFVSLVFTLKKNPSQILKCEYELTNGGTRFVLVSTDQNLTAAPAFDRKVLREEFYQTFGIA